MSQLLASPMPQPATEAPVTEFQARYAATKNASHDSTRSAQRAGVLKNGEVGDE
jgi:hypothetical protein